MPRRPGRQHERHAIARGVRRKQLDLVVDRHRLDRREALRLRDNGQDMHKLAPAPEIARRRDASELRMRRGEIGRRRLQQLARMVEEPLPARAPQDLDPLQDLALQRRSEPANVLQRVAPAGILQLLQAFDLLLLQELACLGHGQARDAQESQGRSRNLEPQAVQRPVRAGAMERRDLLLNRRSDAGDVAQAFLRDQALQRLRQREQPLRRPEIGARLERAVAGELDPLPELAQQQGHLGGVDALVSIGGGAVRHASETHEAA
jgi:hypothetical protein